MPHADRAAIEATILDLVAPGIKGVDLACEVAVLHDGAAEVLLSVLEGMAARGAIVEVEYVRPEDRHGTEARVKSFYLPGGTEARVRLPDAAAA